MKKGCLTATIQIRLARIELATFGFVAVKTQRTLLLFQRYTWCLIAGFAECHSDAVASAVLQYQTISLPKRIMVALCDPHADENNNPVLPRLAQRNSLPLHDAATQPDFNGIVRLTNDVENWPRLYRIRWPTSRRWI